MSNYVYLPQTKGVLPLLDQELIYVDMPTLVHRSDDKFNIVNNLPADVEKDLMFFTSVNEGGCYPRFNTENFYFKVNPDTLITPVVDLKTVQSVSFDEITDQRSFQLRNLLEYYNNVYIFWSGGIDSTLVLSSILKHWTKEELACLIVVCNDNSINEHPKFYKRFIEGKLRTITTDLFYSNTEKVHDKNIYVSTEVADAMIAYSEISEFNKHYPDLYKKSYKKHSKELIEYFGNNRYAYHSYQKIIRSLKEAQLEVDTVYDFLWWNNFNWGFDLEIYYVLWTYSLWPEQINTREFLSKNVFDWFKDTTYQQWSVSAIGSDQKIRDTIQTNKYVFKKYIYDFDNDLDYFLYKEKEPSTPKNDHVHHGKKVVAIDEDWTLYYR